MKKCKPFILTTCLLFSLMGCDTGNISSNSVSPISSSQVGSTEVTSESTSVNSNTSSADTKNSFPSFFTSDNPGYQKTMNDLAEYNPTLFDKNSLIQESIDALGDGVDYYKYHFNLNNSHRVIANVLEIDLKKASIDTNYSAGRACVADSITDYESNSQSKVIAGANADFFGGSSSVNAYIKDQKIIKSGHNDNGSYDYTDPAADIPCSMPLLFGISGTKAQIAPIVKNQSVENTIKAKFTYKILCSHDGENYFSIPTISKDAVRLRSGINIMESLDTVTTIMENSMVYKIRKANDSGILMHGTIEDSYKQSSEIRFQNTDPDYFYIIVTADQQISLAKNDAIAITTGSTDSHWDGYTSVMGGRQALIEDGKISSTVTLENSNGAQVSDIPRTCIGILPDSKVLLTTIEALRYNSNLTDVTFDDSYGVNLPELAQFMRLLGCYDAVNFDGGGSTQLVLKDKYNGEGNQVLAVRSSDYGLNNPQSCRHVYNTILVTTK